MTEVIDLGGPDEYFGYFPTHMALDGDLLYVACSGQNAIAVIDTTTDTLEAFIPTAWYPTAVGVDEASGTIIVANGRGTGTGPGDDEDSQSSLSVFDRPATEDYAALSATVYENNQRTAKFYLDLDFESPIPTERGVPSEQIKRVIFVMKENKTYDQVFGDVPGTEGDPELCIYCGDPTRNFRALAQQFVNCDNFTPKAKRR
ncbi:MAG: hypothetical protein M5R36_19875 [Deltaproteobacteria bacterium]|nr:hypothetical protein [Deltaproteobacteria bacterium]